MQPQPAQPLQLGLKRGIHRPSAKVARLCVQLVFVLALMAQASRPEFWAGLLGSANGKAEAAPIPGTALMDPQQSPLKMPAGMIQSPAAGDQKMELPSDLARDPNTNAPKAAGNRWNPAPSR